MNANANAGSQISRPAAIYERKRASTACVVCRERKTKCDGERPVCGFCKVRGGSCRYIETDASKLDPGSLEVLTRLGRLEESLKSYINEVIDQKLAIPATSPIPSICPAQDGRPPRQRTTSNRLSISSQPQFSATPTQFLNQANQPTLLSVSGSSEHSKPDSATLSDDVPPSTEIISHASDMSLEAVLKWPIFTDLAPNLARDLHTSTIEVLAKDRPITFVTEEDIHNEVKNLTSPVLDRLVENFLTNNHIKNPVLDVGCLRGYVEDFKSLGPQWDGKTCLVLIVCAVSSVSGPLDEIRGVSKLQDCLRIAESYFCASQRRIGMLHHENSIMAGQCTFLTGVYLCLTNQIIAGWKSFVHASNQCLAWLRSNNRLQSKESFVGDETEEMALDPDDGSAKRYVEESLYWSCLKSEMEVRFELNLPGSGLDRFNYQNVYPSPPIHEHLKMDGGKSPEDSMASSAGRSPENSETDRYHLEIGWLYYLAEIASKRIRSSVWVESYTAQPLHARWILQLEKRVTEFDWQIQQWYKALPGPMKFSTDPSVPTRNILRYILRQHMIDIQEDVRFPAIQAIMGSTLSNLDVEQFPPTLIRIVRGFFTNAVDRIEANREGLFHRHHGVWLSIRCVSRSVLQLLGMACKCHREGGYGRGLELERQLLPAQWHNTIHVALDFLEYWSSESADARRMHKVISGIADVYYTLSQ
ncbi:hypothetical protein BGZ63DRAFT_379677 [Mariannaea sp. PMI_226]|nr:hypothetical protein BGZ63DRAFT_379677 [Mariannaea sp. PMI_226]